MGRLDRPWSLEVEELARLLGTDPKAGLAAAHAAHRLATVGRNELAAAPAVPGWRRVLSQFQDPLIYLLLGAVAVSVVAWMIEGRHHWPVDAVVIGLIVILNAVLGHLQEARAQSAVAALARMTAVSSSVMRDGRPLRVPSAELVPGDLLILSEGDAVGADARLVEAAALRVQEAPLTGESQAVLKEVVILDARAPLADRANMVFKGTSVAQGTGHALVTATGMNTEVGAIASMLGATREQPTPLQEEVGHIGRMLGIAVIAIATMVVVTVMLISDIRNLGDVIVVLLLGVSLAVAAVPEGLPAILSVVLAMGVQRMARRNAVVKELSSVETLGSCSVICTDKTGTLTRAEMTIERVVTASGGTRISGVGYLPEGRAEHQVRLPVEGAVIQGDATEAASGTGTLVQPDLPRGSPVSVGGALAVGGALPPEAALLAEDIVVLSGGSLAGNADLRRADDGSWQIQGDPTEAAFLVAERKLGLSERRLQRFERIRELPFTSERKMMSVIGIDHEHDDEAVLISKGAPDVLLQRCSRMRQGMSVVPLDQAWRSRILADIDALSDAALRTLAVAYRPLATHELIAEGAAVIQRAGAEVAAAGVVGADAGTVAGAGSDKAPAGPDSKGAPRTEDLERDLIFVGTVGIIDPPRQEVAAAIDEAHRAGIRVVMITGDHPRTAARIAADLRIVEGDAPVLTGPELDDMDDSAFADAVRTTAVYARVAPQHKLRIVDALQAQGHVVAMTGDGVNDAPALKSADIGIAMGVTGTEVTRQAARMILADDNFATIVEAVREGRSIFDNIRKFLRYLLSSNMGEVLTVFFGVILAGFIGLNGPDQAVVLPLLATQILWINLVTDSGPALAMGIDPQTEDVMAHKPRPPGERMIDGRMWAGVLLVGAAMAVATLLTLDLYLPGGLIEGTRSLDNARTAAFTVLVLAQLFNCFNARSDKASAFRHMLANRWLLGAIALALLLQVAVVNIPFLNVAFGTVPLEPAQWLVCAGMASLVLWSSELAKLLRRRGGPASIA